MGAMTPETWVSETTTHLRAVILDLDVPLEALAEVAGELIEGPRYNKLDPATAAELWARDTR